MSEMWKRLKNWLIKKLGGYTKAEYDDCSRLPVERYVFRPAPVSRDVVTIRAEGRYNYFNKPPDDWLERKLAGELAAKMMECVRFECIDDPCRMETTIRATVRVVDGERRSDG